MPKNSNWLLQFFNDEEDDYTYKKDNMSKSCDIPKIFINKVYLTNSSNGAVSDDECNIMVEALNIHLTTFCNDWSIKPVIVTRSVSPPSGSYQIILTSDPKYTIPGVNGYHMFPLPDGTVRSYICVNAIYPDPTKLPAGAPKSINGILYPSKPNGASVSRVASHELMEMLINPDLSKYHRANLRNLKIPIRDKKGDIITGDINFVAEVSDAVNQQSYTIITSDSTKVQISDYVMPSWFSIVGKSPYNYNNTLQGPLLLSPGGYYSRTTNNLPFTIDFN